MERLNYEIEMLLQTIKEKKGRQEHCKAKLLELQCEILMLDGKNKEEQEVMRKFYEVSVINALENKNLEEFYSHAKRAIDCYLDFDQLDRSTNQTQIHSLYLLYLLINNKTQDFHSHLEQLEQWEQNEAMLQRVLQLERLILQGNYKGFLRQSRGGEYQYFALFQQQFQATIRHEMSRSLEVSYQSLQSNVLASMLDLPDMQALRAYVQQQQNHYFVWKMDEQQQMVYFVNQNLSHKHYDAQQQIKTMLDFTQVLEKVG